MALFFDRLWFEAKLNALELTRAKMAVAGGMSDEDLKLVFKDQMEVSPDHVRAWAQLLQETEHEVARRCGITTTIISPQSDARRILALENRVMCLEAHVRDLIKQLSAKSE